MKVLLIATKASIGGVQVFIVNLARQLQAQGVQVIVAAGAGDFLPSELVGSGIKFYRLNSLSADSSWLGVWRFLQELRGFLKERPVDVVHLNSSHALVGALALTGLRSRPRLIFTVHGLSVLDPNYQLSAGKRVAYRAVYRFFLNVVAKVVFVCQANLKEALKLKLVRQGEVIPNGQDEKNLVFLPRVEARDFFSREIGQDLQGAILVGSVGRLSYQKNFSFPIRQWSEILKAEPAARLIIMGSGEEEAKLRALIASLGLTTKVFILAVVPAQRYLRGLDVFVLPSRYEGLSFSLLEALAAGLPILASRVGGNSEVLRHPGELYELDSEREFSERLLSLLHNPTRREEIKIINKEIAPLFSAAEMARRYREIYS